MTSSSLTGRLGRGLPALVATVFLLACLATAAHLTMDEGRGCQASHPSVGSCEPRVSHDAGPAVAGSATSLTPALAPAQRVTLNLLPLRLSQRQNGPPVPRSPPSPAA